MVNRTIHLLDVSHLRSHNPPALPFAAFLLNSFFFFSGNDNGNLEQQSISQVSLCVQHTGNPLLTWTLVFTTWLLTRAMSSDLLGRLSDERYKQGLHLGLWKDPILLLNLLPLGVLLFSHRPEIQMQPFSPVGHIFTCFSKASYIHIPNKAGCFHCEKGSSSKRLKVLPHVWGVTKPGHGFCMLRAARMGVLFPLTLHLYSC